jgi:signal transduction histidine kinase
LVVSDDGKGMESIAAHKFGIAPRKGVGITSMTTRLRQLGGDLAIRSNARGTTLHGVIPVSANGSGIPAPDREVALKGGPPLD